MLNTAIVISAVWLHAHAAASAPAPSLADIIVKVSGATCPTQEYQVGVTQTISKTGSATEGSAGSGQGSIVSKCTFVLKWTPASGLAISEFKTQFLEAGVGGGKPPDPIQMRVDPIRTLRSMQKSEDAAVTVDSLDGRACYKITSTTKFAKNDMLVTAWVDVDRWCVMKTTGEIKGTRILELRLEQRRVNDTFWMLSKATLVSVPDGSTTVQDFGPYSLEKQ